MQTWGEVPSDFRGCSATRAEAYAQTQTLIWQMQEKTWLARHPLGTSSMHQANILDAVRERAGRRRGGIAVFDHLRPRQTAHIVIDLQNGFMGHGQVAEVPMARARSFPMSTASVPPCVRQVGLWSICSTR
jgi:hypothetical protein